MPEYSAKARRGSTRWLAFMQQQTADSPASSPCLRQQVTGLILAGGRGQRLGGQDKGLVSLNGQPLVSHAISVLRGQVSEVVISANRNLADYASLHSTVVSDAQPGFPGPLAGLLAGLEAATTPWLIVIPCDAPLLPRSLLPRLAAAIGEADVAVVHDGEHLHPVTALMRTGLAADLADYLASGGHKVRDWYQRQHCVTVDFSDCPEAFANLNTESDRYRIAARLDSAAHSQMPRTQGAKHSMNQAIVRPPLPDTLDAQGMPPLLGIAAWSGTGKTTLLEQLLPLLQARGLKVAVIKHAHHDFEIDTPGKDSHRLREAGAVPMLIASSARIAMMIETPDREEADLSELVAMVQPHQPDLILVEGFKSWPLPKLELHRPSLGKPLSAGSDSWVVAVASDASLALPADVEQLDLNDLDALSDWVAAWPARWRQQVPSEVMS